MREYSGEGVLVREDMPLAVEMLEHWAAKLTLRAAPGDAELATEVITTATTWRRRRGETRP